MKQTTNPFDSTALGREIAKQILIQLPPQAWDKLNRRIRARRAQALKAQGDRS